MKLPIPLLAEHYGDNLYRAAFAACRDPQDAEDAVQETLLAYHLSDKQFESEAHIRAWLIRVAVNKARNAATCFWRRNRRALEDYADALEFREPGDRALFDAVMRLGEKYRIAIHLYYYEGYSVREIAQITGSTEQAIKSRLFRSRGMLHERLKGEYQDV